jgi:PAS domain S-box-containing protein
MSEIKIQNYPDPIFIYDKENLRFLDVNDSALNLYGYSRDEFLQMDLTDLYIPEDIQTLLENSQDALKEGEFSEPIRHRKKDGGLLFVKVSRVSYQYEETESYLNILNDVTNYIELEKKNQIYKNAFENTNDMIFITDQDGIITFVNDSASRNLGIPKVDLINTSITSHCDDEDRIFINSSVFQSHIKETVTFTIKLKRHDNQLIETEMTSTPVFSINNEVESFSLFAKLQVEKSVNELEKQEVVREVVKEVIVEKPVPVETGSTGFSAKFLSGLFHEILTPMNVILGFAQELTDSLGNLTPEQKESVDIINQNRGSLLGLMNSIIEYSEIQSEKEKSENSELSVVDLIETLDKNIKEITGIKDVEFAYGKISSSLKFKTDKKKFESLTNNILRLVSKFTSKKKIYFSAYPVEDNSFHISVSDGFGRVSSNLFDTLKKLFIEKREPKEVGVSRLNFQIITALLDKLDGQYIIFNEFTDKPDIAFRFPMVLSEKVIATAKNKVKETAEPVAKENEEEAENIESIIKDSTEEVEIDIDDNNFKNVVQEEVQEPLTEIDVEPEKEIEPEAEFEPRQQESPESEQPVEEEIKAIEPEKKPESRNGLSALRCLYIEDQVDSQILFKVQMKDLKNIQFAASFEEALPLLENNEFDFIIMDINLQGEYNGLDALKVIHQIPKFENIPVIAVTAYVLPGDKEKFIATGFTDFISKPIFRDKLVESLKKIFVN